MGPQGGEGGAGGRGVGRGDLALEGGVEEVVPGVGDLDAELVELGLVGAEAERADVHAGPVAVGVLVLGGDLLRLGGLVGLDEPLVDGLPIAVDGPAVPDVELGAVLGRGQAGNGLTGGEAHVGGLDAGVGGEGLGPGLAEVFHGAASDGDGAIAVAAGGGIGGARASGEAEARGEEDSGGRAAAEGEHGIAFQLSAAPRCADHIHHEP